MILPNQPNIENLFVSGSQPNESDLCARPNQAKVLYAKLRSLDGYNLITH